MAITNRRLIVWCIGAPAAAAVSRSLLGEELSLTTMMRRQPIELSTPFPCTIFATYHPEYVRRVPQSSAVVAAHVTRLHDYLLGIAPITPSPHIVPNRAPRLDDPRTISLDTETAGAITGLGQSSFHPTITLAHDSITAHQLVQTAAITLIENGTPGVTMTFNMQDAADRIKLLKWLRHVTTIVGMNLLYDLSWLRACSPHARSVLPAIEHHTLVDISILNMLHSEIRPERGLKDLARSLLGVEMLDPLTKGVTFPTSTNQQLHAYNASDSHYTACLAGTLTQMIRTDYPDTDKLSDYSGTFYSDLISSTLRLSEAGVPYSLPALHALDARCRTTMESSSSILTSADITPSGTGSLTARRRFMDSVIADVPYIVQHPLFSKTTGGSVSVNKLNRQLVVAYLSPDDPRLPIFTALDNYEHTSTLVEHFITPLLHQWLVHRGSHRTDVGIVYPAWYLTPSPFKEERYGEGGTMQGRITCSKPGEQTNPAEIKACRSSRYPGGTLLTMDLSQAEPRTGALLSGDTYLLEAFQQGRDIHSDLAICVEGEGIVNDPYWKSGDNVRDQRQLYKTCRLAVMYGGTPITMVRQVLKKLGRLMDFERARSIIDMLHHQCAGFYEWADAQVQACRSTGCVTLPFTGQSRHVDASVDPLVVVNMPIQTAAANVLLRIQAYCSVNLPSEIKMCLNTYDALTFDCPPGTSQIVRSVLETAIQWVTTTDYWGMLSRHYGNTVPLLYETKETNP